MDLFVSRDDAASATVVSNLFIDEYMKDANDAQIKVYLYLLRMMSAGLSTDIPKMADLFNHTERDILRALKYWEQKGLLRLEYDDLNSLSGIKFLKPNTPGSKQKIPSPVSSSVPVTLKVVPEEEDVPKFRENVSYSKEQIKEFKEAEDTSQIVFVAEQYLKRTLSASDIQSLYFIVDELKFTCEMTDYLLQYCLDRGKESFSYIKKVAISWAQSGISTPKQAKALAGTRYEKYVYTVLKALGKSNVPQPPEADMVIKWYREFGFPLDIILEACNRTVMATESHRLEYCDKILSGWKNEGVHHMEDIQRADADFKRSRQSQRVVSSVTAKGMGQFTRTDYDFDALEKIMSN